MREVGTVLNLTGKFTANALILPVVITVMAICGCAETKQSVMVPPPPVAQTAGAWEGNGIKVVRIGRAMNGTMLDLRYRITDLAKAEKILTRQARMELIDQQSGTVLTVPNMPKVGKLRQVPNKETQDRLFWVFFNNSDMRVKRGDKVTLKIDGLTIENIVVE